MRATLLYPLALALLATLSLANVVVDLTQTAKFDVSVGQDRPALVAFTAPWCGHCKKLHPVYEEVAAAYSSQPGRVLIANVNADENKELGKRHEIKGFPTIKYFPANSPTTESETYSGPRTVEALVAFIDGKVGTKGKVKQPPPPAVKHLTNADFKDVVYNPNANVLVEYYAPWCGHCKNLAPIYESVAQTFANDDDCVVAALDADAEAHRPIAQEAGIQSFPTLKFYPKGGKDAPEAYTGGRGEDDFINFLNGKCGTFRTKGGGLSELAGRLPSLDSLASRFYSASDDLAERTTILSEAKDFVTRSSASVNATEAKNAAAAYYLKVMDKINSDPSWLTKETNRIKALIEGSASGAGALAGKKVDELKKKANVLAAFTKRNLSDRAKQAEEKAKKLKEEL